jgi:hypothetical protein
MAQKLPIQIPINANMAYLSCCRLFRMRTSASSISWSVIVNGGAILKACGRKRKRSDINLF